MTAAIVHGDIMRSILQQLSRPASPTNSFAIGELSQLVMTLQDDKVKWRLEL